MKQTKLNKNLPQKIPPFKKNQTKTQQKIQNKVAYYISSELVGSGWCHWLWLTRVNAVGSAQSAQVGSGESRRRDRLTLALTTGTS